MAVRLMPAEVPLTESGRRLSIGAWYSGYEWPWLLANALLERPPAHDALYLVLTLTVRRRC